MNEKTRSACRYGLGALAVFVLTFGYLFAQVFNLSGDVEKNGASIEKAMTAASQAQQQAQAAKEGVEEANRRLRAAGKPTVPVPTVTPLPSIPTPVTDEFTAEEAAAVRVIVADQIARQKVQITQEEISQIARVASALVPKPKDGRTPTAAELQPIVTATVAAYCVGDKCVGKAGTKGDKGDRGDDAPKVTDEELLAAAQAALTSYCAQESKPCDGKDGADGKDGPQGTPGRGITGTTCQDDGTWLFTYTDGSTETVEGPCRVLVPPNPARTGN